MIGLAACRRKLAGLVLSLALLAPWPAGALPFDRSAREPGADVVSRLIEWLASVFGDIGCSMDPDGRCRDSSVSPPPTSGDDLDIGCSMDPNGRCRDTSDSEPSAPGENVEIGCSWDPGGGACADRE
jgi:hypothetical protein